MMLVLFIVSLFTFYSTCQTTSPTPERSLNGETLTDNIDGTASFGFELLLINIEKLEAKLQEQNSIHQQQLDTLERRLDEMHEMLRAQDSTVRNLQQKLFQSEFQLHQVKDNLIKRVFKNEENIRQMVSLSSYPSCREAPTQAGIQKIRFGSQIVPSYCEQNDYGGGWLVIQSRSTGGVESFNRPWLDYLYGFGSPAGDHWWGLEKVEQLTKSYNHELLVEVTDFYGVSRWVKWNRFQLGGVLRNFDISKLEGCSGNGSCAGLETNEPFSTYDRINKSSCKNLFPEGGWWLKKTCKSNLNAEKKNYQSNMMWNHSKVKSSRMMIRKIN